MAGAGGTRGFGVLVGSKVGFELAVGVGFGVDVDSGTEVGVDKTRAGVRFGNGRT